MLFSLYSFLGSLETAIIESKSVTITPHPNVSPKVSAYSWENSFSSPIGEYFF